MSAILMGAVMARGPAGMSLRFTLLAIADNADDYGFACPSMETIAAKACSGSSRTAMRRIAELERDGWLRVERHVFGGRGNVYFLSLDKIGAAPGEKSRKNRLHEEVEALIQARKPSDKLACGNEKPCDKTGGCQVTKTAFPCDKSRLLNKKNHQEPSKNHKNPQTPLQARGQRQPDAEATSRNAEGNPEVTAARVMAECGISNPRMVKIVLLSLACEVKATGCSAEEAGTRMVQALRDYANEAAAGVLRFPVGVRKFFGDGIWRDRGRWAYDKAAVNRRNAVSVGCSTRKPEPAEDWDVVPDGLVADGAAEAWSAIRDGIRANLDPQKFDTWIKNVRPVGIREPLKNSVIHSLSE